MPGERRVAREEIKAVHLLLIAISVLFGDQLTKLLLKDILTLGSSIPVIKGLFHLTLVLNRGAAFGIFKDQGVFFIAIGIICASLMLLYLRRLEREAVFIKVGSALVLGGILGNLIDRLRFGYVVDFLDFRVWPVFNVADSAITIGAALILINLLRQKRE